VSSSWPKGIALSQVECKKLSCLGGRTTMARVRSSADRRPGFLNSAPTLGVLQRPISEYVPQMGTHANRRASMKRTYFPRITDIVGRRRPGRDPNNFKRFKVRPGLNRTCRVRNIDTTVDTTAKNACKLLIQYNLDMLMFEFPILRHSVLFFPLRCPLNLKPMKFAKFLWFCPRGDFATVDTGKVPPNWSCHS
jgi:hypothetical protein